MKQKDKRAMFAYMAAHDNDDLSDGAWQAVLEDAAEDWGRHNGKDVDGFDAFMEYVTESAK